MYTKLFKTLQLAEKNLVPYVQADRQSFNESPTNLGICQLNRHLRGRKIEMPEINPKVACHQLTIYPSAKVAVQRHWKQSPEKAEAFKKL
ncbi:hypothetical protein L195_g019724 [Trifolium pratense]|uniref:Uncharacterized protein n=1 Tax=Trifolium pratense TaxID=57577 RepID=A0A2K3N0E0_TRIPR|nr:hypothetical protein L195_g019724 [Trifolium pratense]